MKRLVWVFWGLIPGLILGASGMFAYLAWVATHSH